MIRGKPASQMQKTYDECYLICSTAVFFEGQNNEAEALRSWKEALDVLYAQNMRLKAAYTPKTETERALHESLKQMELQCKERVELLEALKKSRVEAGKPEYPQFVSIRHESNLRNVSSLPESQSSSWMGDNTIAPIQTADLPHPSNKRVARAPPPPPPSRNNQLSRGNEDSYKRRKSPPTSIQQMGPPPPLAVPKPQSRSPSPEGNRRTMRTTLRSDRRPMIARSSPNPSGRPAPMKAAGLAWTTDVKTTNQEQDLTAYNAAIEARLSATAARRSLDQASSTIRYETRRNNSAVEFGNRDDNREVPPTSGLNNAMEKMSVDHGSTSHMDQQESLIDFDDSPVTSPQVTNRSLPEMTVSKTKSAEPKPKAAEISYRREYPPGALRVPPSLATHILDKAYAKTNPETKNTSGIVRRPVANRGETANTRRKKASTRKSDGGGTLEKGGPPSPRTAGKSTESLMDLTPSSTDVDSASEDTPEFRWKKKSEDLMTNLPKGVDEAVAKNILNEIVVRGDEVHWDDVAGLEAAKKALKEAVVYPFLRPDLFMGLREPARGMLLFGPPGTGKTMLARAVATESKSTFFAISASSLTSKWHGESEKLVRALFALAKALAPSIIFVDEIDSLLSARSGSSEHEASRRSKTEFLIQWSDLQRAAAGKDTTVGDATRVLVLAATNCPWDIDDAARRRFVRRQYIPLPEFETRELQIRTLIGHQKHSLNAKDIWRLVQLTEGYSGSDITALAKDAAMGPLRNLGEALLYTPMDQIRPIQMSDFEASLESIRPSVSKKGLDEFEEWAREFGERGG